MTGQSRFERHSGRIFAGLWALAIVAGLTLLEWALTPADGRFSGDARSYGGAPARHLVLREWGRDTDYRMAPTEARKRHADAGLEPVYAMAIDAEGFIAPARTHANPDWSVVFLGGSTTECLFVAPKNRFPHLAARRLEAALDAKVNGINAARSGNNAMHSLLLLLGKVIPLRPDFVVISHTANDIGALSAHGGYWMERGSTRLVANEEITAAAGAEILARSLLPNSSQFLYRAWRNLRTALRGNSARAAAAETAARRDEELGREFARALTSSVRLAQTWGITPVLMTQVRVEAGTDAERRDDFLERERLAGAKVSRAAYPTLHAYFNAVTRQVAERTGAMLIDLAGARGWRYGEVYDGIHFTDRGSRIAAGIIAARLAEAIRARAAN